MAKASPIIQDGILTDPRDGSPVQIVVDSSDWYAWLQTASTFTFRHEHGGFTAHKEQAGNRRGRPYWRAYHTRHGKLQRIYLGQSEELTLDRLRAIAAMLADQEVGGDPLSGQEGAIVTRVAPANSSNDSHHPPLRALKSNSVKARSFFSELPAQLTPLIGREREVAIASALLRRAEVRLLTLTGTGGVGKTRLGLRVATELIDDFVDGICFVPLAPLNDPELLIPTIARTLGLWERARSPLEQAKAYLHEKHLLLLLDNFEHLLVDAPLLVELLVACYGLKMLVTSRAVLHIQGEHEFAVSPLEVPDLKRLPALEVLSQYAAVALFVQRVQAVQPDFRLTSAHAATIAEICVRLDGLPLAIELAAARVKLLPPQALLARLGHRLQLLTSSAQDVPARQQTLRNTITWSYELLDAAEQQLFRRLSVFVGSCTLEAIEAVCTALETNTPSMSVLDGLASLVDKSLLQQREQEGEEACFVMLETIREYGLERLAASKEAVVTQRAHANYYLSLAEKAEPYLNGAEQLKWVDRLEREHDNLRTALNCLIEWKETEMALRLGSALWLFWLLHAHVSEGQRWLERALEGSEGVTLIRAKALYAAARMAYYRSDYSQATFFNEESLKLYRELGDKRGIAVALNSLGHLSLAQGDYAGVHNRCQESLPLLKEVGDRWRIAEALFLLSYESHARSNYSRARALCEESLALCRQVGDRNGTAQVLHALGFFAYHQNDFVAAYALHEESLAIAREVGQKWLIAACLEGLGEVVASHGQLEWASQLWGAAETLRETIGMSIPPVERATYERAVTAARAKLGEKTFAAAWAEGRTMSPEQAFTAPRSMMISEQNCGVPDPTTSEKMAATETTGLTGREMEVLRLVAYGLTDAQVAAKLVISPRTVNWHLTSIYSKLQVSSRSAATRYAIEHNLL